MKTPMRERHWYVLIFPDFYDDPADVGFAWSGAAMGYDDAVAKACRDCEFMNGDVEIDETEVKVGDCHIDLEHHAKELLTAVKTLDGAQRADDFGRLYRLVLEHLDAD